MSKLIKYLPGFVGAVGAFAVLKLVGLLTLGSMALEFLIFICAYLIIAVLLDQAMARYGTSDQ